VIYHLIYAHILYRFIIQAVSEIRLRYQYYVPCMSGRRRLTTKVVRVGDTNSVGVSLPLYLLSMALY